MAFQTPRTVEDILQSIHRRDYLMPAIQREFVWGTSQIVRLIDSLMRGYPVGSFLLWDVKPETARSYSFYEFLTHYHERDNPYAQKASVSKGYGTIAILDGQQRLTSLNIALYGTFAEKRKYAWWNSADAFPAKRLYLNLLEDPTDEELGLKYDLRFLTDKEAQPSDGADDKWFRVGDVLELEDSGPAMMRLLEERSITGSSAFQRLYDLYEAVRVLKPINYFLVTDQDADKVLEIFVRINSGGTTLSYSDLLLSMATNQWSELDAREEVRALVLEMNTKSGRQFAFTKDNVLKSALSVTDADLRFKVANFTQANMAAVENSWPDIRASLLRAATLLQQFGFNERNLSASSVLIPIAHYLYRREAGDSYLDSTSDAKDRSEIKRWVTRSLVKRGIWGSGLDTLLGRIRDAIDAADVRTGFPVEAIENTMAAVGKGLRFSEAEVDDLLGLKYAGQRTFAVLTILYPGLDLSKKFHEDHIFPKSLFTRKKLLAAGMSDAEADEAMRSFNLLPNLQLLAGTANIQKQDLLPSKWVDLAFVDSPSRESYLAENDLQDLPTELSKFLEFFRSRQSRIRARLLAALNSQ
jgi:hypothetical protein